MGAIYIHGTEAVAMMEKQQEKITACGKNSARSSREAKKGVSRCEREFQEEAGEEVVKVS